MPLVISPLLGFVIAFFRMIGLLWLVKDSRPALVARRSRWMQLVSASAMAFSHGATTPRR